MTSSYGHAHACPRKAGNCLRIVSPSTDCVLRIDTVYLCLCRSHSSALRSSTPSTPASSGVWAFLFFSFFFSFCVGYEFWYLACACMCVRFCTGDTVLLWCTMCKHHEALRAALLGMLTSHASAAPQVSITSTPQYTFRKVVAALEGEGLLAHEQLVEPLQVRVDWGER